jgi:hypothetical protein
VDLYTGQRTQTWLAVSDEPAAMVSGRYWHHLRQEEPAGEASNRPGLGEEAGGNISAVGGHCKL